MQSFEPHHTGDTRSTRIFVSALLLGIMAVMSWAYWPGLTGPFVLDDATNIAPLGDDGGIRSSDDFWRFVLGGKAGPLGRPLSLATFAANSQQWPTDPWPFKVTNLAIHGLNTVLIYLLGWMLLRRAHAPRAAVAAATAAALWALHPLHVSTVLYVVQRMTELATLFTLSGLIAFVYGRQLALRSPIAGYTWIVTGIGGGSVLASLCKESGILLPLYALVLEVVILRQFSSSPPPRWRLFGTIFMVLPAIALAIYPILKLPDFIHTYSAIREFTMSERVLTQGRVLIDYLGQIAVPRLSGTGVFHDDFPVSHGIFDPPTTLLAWLAVAAMLTFAIRSIRSQPVLALGILWFFAGHSLEASFIPLELYFEHRNYLPSFGLAVVVAHYAINSEPRYLRAAIVFVGAFVLVETGLTRNQASIWGNERVAAEVWANEHPDSLRAQLYISHYWNARGDYAKGLSAFERATELHPNSATARLHVMELRCRQRVDVDGYAQSAIDVLRRGPFDFAGPDSLARTQRLVADGRCPGLSIPTLMLTIDAYAENPSVSGQPAQRAYLGFIKASALAASGRLDAAVATMDQAENDGSTLIKGYWQAVWSMEAGSLDLAGRYCATALADYRERFGQEPLDPALKTLQERLAYLTESQSTSVAP